MTHTPCGNAKEDIMAHRCTWVDEETQIPCGRLAKEWIGDEGACPIHREDSGWEHKKAAI